MSPFAIVLIVVVTLFVFLGVGFLPIMRKLGGRPAFATDMWRDMVPGIGLFNYKAIQYVSVIIALVSVGLLISPQTTSAVILTRGFWAIVLAAALAGVLGSIAPMQPWGAKVGYGLIAVTILLVAFVAPPAWNTPWSTSETAQKETEVDRLEHKPAAQQPAAPSSDARPVAVVQKIQTPAPPVHDTAKVFEFTIPAQGLSAPLSIIPPPYYPGPNSWYFEMRSADPTAKIWIIPNGQETKKVQYDPAAVVDMGVVSYFQFASVSGKEEKIFYWWRKKTTP